MEAPAFCRFLDWDSDFFGVRIASIAAASSDHAIDPERMASALAWCRRESIACVYLLSDSADLVTLRAAEARGFQLMDVRMTFDKEIDSQNGAGEPTAGSGVRVSREADIPALRAIAAESHTASRFYADGRFSRARCDELYATWIEKSCRGWADKVFVAEHEGRPRGYLSVHLRPAAGTPSDSVRTAKRGEIGIVAVAPDAQGLGLGGRLVEHGLAWFGPHGARRVSVVTQGRNTGAQRLYESRGFRSSSVQLWHHLWFDRETLRA